MMKRTLAGLVVGTTAMACSGHYYEVGEMDGAGGTGGSMSAGGSTASNSGATAGSTGATDSGVGTAGRANDAGIGALACAPPGLPGKVTGPFAEPQVVWKRITRFTWGDAMPPAAELPATTTYAWAGSAVKAALKDSKGTLGTVPGVEVFLRQALELAPTVEFTAPWGLIASSDDTLLSSLLTTALGETGRIGIFTEPSWLSTKTTISARGVSIEHALFGFNVPPPPPDQGVEPIDPELQDRAALEKATSAPPCQSCHSLFDPSGYTLGHFAADGSYRKLDHGMPIDTTGARRAQGTAAGTIEFDGIADFGNTYQNSCEALLGIADSFLRAALALDERPEAEQFDLFEANKERIEQAFVNGPRTYESLLKAYIQSPAGLMP